ncbi:MAG: hypothetical protein WCV71_05155 [Patescibacteria group bacterium]
MSINNKHHKILLALFLLFFVLYNFTNIFVYWPMLISTGHLIFNWPDATANYFFTELFAKTNQFWYFEPLNLLTDNLLHPRSFNAIAGNLVPISFLPSLVVFGAAFRILGQFGILALTPFLAALSGLLIYRLVYYIFKDLDLSLISAVLFWSLAPVVFFANEVMLPSILFIFLVLSGFWALAKSWLYQKSWYWFLGLLFLSLAVFVRPTEILWLSLVFVFVLYINRSKVDFKKYTYGGLIFIVMAFLFLSLNKATYGAYLSTGYFNFQSGGLSPEFAQPQARNLWDYVKLLLMPFGFDLFLILKNFYKYFANIILPHLLLAIIGLVILFYKKQINFAWRKYLMLLPFIFALILIYYGSWDIVDPLVKELNKISISYVRYFLPLYIYLLPLVAWAIKKIFFGPTKINKLAYYIVLIALILSSLKLAFFSKHDGLFYNLDTLKDYYTQYQIVSEKIEDKAIIITDRSDKIFFPKYRVIVPQGDLELWPRVKNIIDQAPIYYYTDKSGQDLLFDLEAANQVKLDLTNPSEIWANFRLFEVKNRE